MPRAFTLADKIADQPAIIREAHPLFDFAREQAAAAKILEAKLAAARERHERTVTVLHESMEWRELEAAKDALKKTAKSALKAEKTAKSDVKALATALAKTERGIVHALKVGRAPSPLIRDDAADAAT